MKNAARGKELAISGDPIKLRRLAEIRLRDLQKGLRSNAPVKNSGADKVRLLHELEVHQIELEMQNAELHKARNELEITLEKFMDLYDFAPVGYFTLDASGIINRVNLTGAALVGMERSRLVGQSFGRLISTEFRPVFNIFLKQIFSSQTKQTDDFEILRQGHPIRIVNIEAQCLLKGLECHIAMVDITDRKQVEDKVRVSEIRYRRLFEAAHDGVLLLDPKTCKITDANPFMTKLLGYSNDQLVGKELFEIGLLKDEVASRGMFQKLKQKHQIRYENLPLESKKGKHQEVEVVANLYQENGRSVIQCNVRDITERKQAEEVLLRSEALFSALVLQVPVGVYLVDSKFRLQQVNPKALPVFKNVRPLIGRDFSEVIHILWSKSVADQIVKRFRHTLKTGETYQSPEFTEQRRDTGATEVYEWQIQRMTLPAGENGVVCFFNNITERKRIEGVQRRLEVLTASNEKLEKEIVQRWKVEKALKKSEEDLSRLLELSRFMEEKLGQFARQILSAQEEERKVISRELHDVIAQTLAGINVRLAKLKKDATLNSHGLIGNISRTQRLVEKSVKIVHQFARELRPALLDDLGLIPALHSYMKNFTTRTGVRARLIAFAGVERLDTDRRTVLFRVTQEALTNVARHAKASRVEVSIQKLPDGIGLKIKDDGKSFRVQQVLLARGGKHLGLLGMRERLKMVDGRFEVKSAPGKGTTIIAKIPIGKTRTKMKSLMKSAKTKS